jgi:hypothetical protein
MLFICRNEVGAYDRYPAALIFWAAVAINNCYFAMMLD